MVLRKWEVVQLRRLATHNTSAQEQAHVLLQADGAAVHFVDATEPTQMSTELPKGKVLTVCTCTVSNYMHHCVNCDLHTVLLKYFINL